MNVWIMSPHYGKAWVEIQKEWTERNTPKHKINWVLYYSEQTCPHIRAITRLMRTLDEKHPARGDLVVMMDSDAFPIVPNWVEKTMAYLSSYKFVAVQRLENPFKQRLNPHPSYCAWLYGNICPDWSQWSGNPYIKPGAYRWKPLHRTNKVNLHQQLYAIYDDMIYHHGCGSRKAVAETEVFFQKGLAHYDDFFKDPKSFIEKLRHG